MTEKTLEVELAPCSDAVNAAVAKLLLDHDTRLVFAALGAQVGHLGALLRVAKVYSDSTVARMLAECLVTAMTMQVQPKIIYTDGETTGSKQ